MRSAVLVVLLALGVAACGEKPTPREPSALKLTRPPATSVAAALSGVPETRASLTRLGFVDMDALADAQLARTVLGTAAPRAGVAVRAGDELVTPGRPAMPTSISADAMSVTQSCLGGTAAQTILGPQTMGEDAALGVGLRLDNGQRVVRICAAPHFKSELRAFGRALSKALPAADVAEDEVVERAIMTATVPADALTSAELRDFLEVGAGVRQLAWR